MDKPKKRRDPMTGRRDARTTERFSRIPIFSRMTTVEVSRILMITDEVKLAAGEDLFAPGDPPDSYYIILGGKIDIRIPRPNLPEPLVIATLSTRSVFGEMSFLGERPRSAYATAREDSRLNKVDGAAFRDMMEKGDLAAYKVIHNFARLTGSRLSRVEKELLEVLEEVVPADTRDTKLAEMQQFRNKLFEEWSF